VEKFPIIEKKKFLIDQKKFLIDQKKIPYSGKNPNNCKKSLIIMVYLSVFLLAVIF